MYHFFSGQIQITGVLLLYFRVSRNAVQIQTVTVTLRPNPSCVSSNKLDTTLCLYGRVHS